MYQSVKEQRAHFSHLLDAKVRTFF